MKYINVHLSEGSVLIPDKHYFGAICTQSGWTHYWIGQNLEPTYNPNSILVESSYRNMIHLIHEFCKKHNFKIVSKIKRPIKEKDSGLIRVIYK